MASGIRQASWVPTAILRNKNTATFPTSLYLVNIGPVVTIVSRTDCLDCNSLWETYTRGNERVWPSLTLYKCPSATNHHAATSCNPNCLFTVLSYLVMRATNLQMDWTTIYLSLHFLAITSTPPTHTHSNGWNTRKFIQTLDSVGRAISEDQNINLRKPTTATKKKTTSTEISLPNFSLPPLYIHFTSFLIHTWVSLGWQLGNTKRLCCTSCASKKPERCTVAAWNTSSNKGLELSKLWGLQVFCTSNFKNFVKATLVNRMEIWKICIE